MSKADEIVALIRREGRLPDKVIAERVGCAASYVRAALKRRGPDRVEWRKHETAYARIYQRAYRSKMVLDEEFDA